MVWRSVSRPLSEFPLSATDDELLNKVAGNPIHVFKMIIRINRDLEDILEAMETDRPDGKATALAQFESY